MRRIIAAIAIALLLCGRAAAQSDTSDYTTTVGTTPVQVLPSTGAGRSQIMLQVIGTAAVACRANGTPSFTGGSLVLVGGTGTPAIGGSAILEGAGADPGVWQCVAYAGTVTLVVKAYH